jgi:DNA repair protein RadC
MKKQMEAAARNKVAEVKLVYKSQSRVSDRPVISSSKDAADIFRHAWDEDTIDLCEEFKVLLLSRSNRVLAIFPLSKGSVTGTIADPKLIFIAALKAAACAIVVAHNHPSGSLKPSRADEALTHKLKEAGRFLDVLLLDHIILSSEGFYSFADEGLV